METMKSVAVPEKNLSSFSITACLAISYQLRARPETIIPKIFYSAFPTPYAYYSLRFTKNLAIVLDNEIIHMYYQTLSVCGLSIKHMKRCIIIQNFTLMPTILHGVQPHTSTTSMSCWLGTSWVSFNLLFSELFLFPGRPIILEIFPE